MVQPPTHNAPPEDTRPALLVLLFAAGAGLVLLVAIIGIIVMVLGTGAVAQPAHQTTTAPITPSAAPATPVAAARTTTAPITPSVANTAPATPVAAARVLPTATTHTYGAAPPMTINLAHTYTATITTPRGPIVITLLPDIAPQTVNNFVFLARQNFYNGLTWHRVIQGFIAQGGDPMGDGTGGPGYSIPAEFTDKILYDTPGLLAMARTNDPNSAGSQFFITTAPAPTLNSLYTIFGRVTQGQDIVDGIPLRDLASATSPGETILGITIIEGE